MIDKLITACYNEYVITIKRIINVLTWCAAALIVCPLFALLFTKIYGTNLIPFYIALGITSAFFVPAVIYLGRMIAVYYKTLKTAPKLSGTVSGRTYEVWGTNHWCRLEINCDGQTYRTPKVYTQGYAYSVCDKRDRVEFILIKNRAYITDVTTIFK
ncbi:MAG: hypothetical protein NC033_06465 [Clostridiales bacterium]|nr:hypothetical protein [Clostridiales bacterium]